MNGELYHHGIKGMHWGIRRYQNEDGSLTPAGKARAARQEIAAKNKFRRQQASKEAAAQARAYMTKRLAGTTMDTVDRVVDAPFGLLKVARGFAERFSNQGGDTKLALSRLKEEFRTADPKKIEQLARSEKALNESLAARKKEENNARFGANYTRRAIARSEMRKARYEARSKRMEARANRARTRAFIFGDSDAMKNYYSNMGKSKEAGEKAEKYAGKAENWKGRQQARKERRNDKRGR